MIDFRHRALELFVSRNSLKEKQKKQLGMVLESLDLAVTACFLIDGQILIETNEAVIDLKGNVSMFYQCRPKVSLVEQNTRRDKLRARRAARWKDWEQRQEYNENCTSEALKQRALRARIDARKRNIQWQIDKRLIEGGRE